MTTSGKPIFILWESSKIGKQHIICIVIIISSLFQILKKNVMMLANVTNVKWNAPIVILGLERRVGDSRPRKKR